MRIVWNVRHVTCALIAVLLLAVLAACGGGSSGGSESSTYDGSNGRAAPAGPAKAPESRTGGTDTTGGAAPGSGKGTGTGTSRVQVPPPAGHSVVYTATLQVRAGDVDASATKAKQLVTAAGGYVENESGTSSPASSQLTLKIPAERYAELLARLSTDLGTKTGLTQRAEDVTGEVADVDSRVRSAQAALASFRKLLDRARTVGEVIDVEQEIASREADLEALQARQKALQQSTRYATLTVELRGPAKTAAPKKDRGGFAGGLRDGWHAFTGFAGGVATVLGWLLPFLAAAAAIGLPLLAFRHRLRDRRADPPGATTEAEPREAVPAGAVSGGAGGEAPPPGGQAD
ncbi:DUF4349 domain-containing protein [Actinomadura fibrosa]|uniref:DUF4349 domain-containing protein n=1 Tax=Actinomadura fibrosa TaxID=111802 RepID=A0ABW2XSQ8_9ACTN|nr:DUF4349 domain-containing protein [Actinomadura fibrosa]